MPQSRLARMDAIKSTAVNRVLQEIRQVEATGKNVISLMRGQPDTPTPRPIVQAAIESLRMGRTGYPDNRGELHLRQAVAEKLQRDNGLSYDPITEILVTDGATLGIYAALGSLIDSGADVLLPDPIYDAYYAPIALWRGRPISVPSTIQSGRFTIPRTTLDKLHTPQSRVLLLNSPWNPVGTVFSREELQELFEFALELDLLIISDEIYEALIYDGQPHISLASLSSAARSRTVIVNSLSKTYAMTGWRIGYCAGPAHIIQAMFLILQQSSRGPATFVQDAAAFALSTSSLRVNDMAVEYRHRRDRVVHALRDFADVAPLVPQGGLFVMLDVRRLGRPSDEIRRFLLHEAGVAVIHGAAYGPAGEGFLRISFAAGGDILEQGLDRLRNGLLRLLPG